MSFINIETMEHFYFTHKQMNPSSGHPQVTTCHFNKNFVVPLERFPEYLQGQANISLDVDELLNLEADGWFEIHRDDRFGDGPPYLHFYIADRIAFFLKLKRLQIPPAELRFLAAWEEALVDNLLTSDTLSYEYDPWALLFRAAQERLRIAELHLEYSPHQVLAESTKKVIATLFRAPMREDPEKELKQARASLERLQDIHSRPLSPAQQELIEREAYYVALTEESLRLTLIQADRDKFEAGYSPVVVFNQETWGNKVTYKDPDWSRTIEDPWLSELRHIGIRVPGFIIKDDSMFMPSALAPGEYKRLWSENHLDEYLQALAKSKGEKRCLHCQRVISMDGSPRRSYCSDNCREAAKQQRYRMRHPEIIKLARQKY